jgi:hypothetical protein
MESTMKITQDERRKEKDLMDRIQAADVPVAVESKKGEAPSLLIRQDFDAYDSTLFNFDGGTGLILSLKITVDTPLFVLCGVDVSLASWPNVWFRLQEENDGGEWPHYQFQGRPHFKFDRRETINCILTEQKKFRRGELLHGLLLASTFDPIPDDIVRGAILKGSIKICDQFERENCGEISLSVDREAERVPKPNPLRRRLFSRPDAIAGSEGPDDGKE